MSGDFKAVATAAEVAGAHGHVGVAEVMENQPSRSR